MTNRVSKIISDQSLNRGIQIESNGKPNAAATSSTATGLFQFLNQSWLETLFNHGPENIRSRIKKTGPKGKPFQVPDGGERAILDLRKAAGDPAKLKINIDMGARFWEDNARAIGKGFTDADLYMAHFLGAGSARKVFASNQGATAVSVCGSAAANANPTIFYEIKNGKRVRAKTVAELRAWAGNAMRTRWDKAGQPDWVDRYYPKEAAVEVDTPSLDDAPDDDTPPMKIDPAGDNADDDTADDAEVSSQSAVDDPARPIPSVPATAPTLPAGETIKGDPETWWVQYRLKAMHYGPALVDGRYGGKTSAAIAGFLNDWPEEGSHLTPPKSIDEFLAVREDLKGELSKAEAEGFVRPVTVARANGDAKLVAEVAPETKPIQSNISLGWFGTIGTAITGFFTWAGDSLSSAWNFYTSNEDSIPDAVKDPSILSKIGHYVATMPGYFWLAAACAAFLFFTVRSHTALNSIVDKVKTGER